MHSSPSTPTIMSALHGGVQRGTHMYSSGSSMREHTWSSKEFKKTVIVFIAERAQEACGRPQSHGSQIRMHQIRSTPFHSTKEVDHTVMLPRAPIGKETHPLAQKVQRHRCRKVQDARQYEWRVTEWLEAITREQAYTRRTHGARPCCCRTFPWR